jgi:hypothetical protein
MPAKNAPIKFFYGDFLAQPHVFHPDRPNWRTTTTRLTTTFGSRRLPAHTPHHVAVCFGRDGDDAVMPWDLIHSPLQARYPELSPRFDVDGEAAAETRRSFLERYCDTRTLCCTAHFPSPSIGRVKRWDNGFRCDYIDDYIEA